MTKSLFGGEYVIPPAQERSTSVDVWLGKDLTRVDSDRPFFAAALIALIVLTFIFCAFA